MVTPRRIGLVVAAGVGLVLALVARPSNAATGYTLSGAASGLYPGASVPMVITISSTDTRPIKVTSIGAVFKSPAIGCEAAKFQLAALKAPVVVPAKGSAKVTLNVSLAKTAASACAGRAVSVTFVSAGTY